MPTLLVIRLYPDAAVSANTFFDDYLPGLAIDAHELSFADPGGDEPALGTAEYRPPTFPLPPVPDQAPLADPATRITQHFRVAGSPGVRTMFAVATAVIEIPDPPGGREHDTADIRLVVKRNGATVLRQTALNVPVAPAPLPGNPNAFPALTEVGLYVEVPPSTAGTGTGFVLPEDGAPPPFASLRTAVEDVLDGDPGSTTGIADLTFAQARHVAREIAWDRAAHPLPVPGRPLEEIYTGPHDADSDEERERQVFEGDLLMRDAARTTESDRLTEFVFALSAAIWCERRAAANTRAGFPFPVFPDRPDRLRRVFLAGVGTAPLDPAPVVPAEYFYALTAVLPHQVEREQRYELAVLDGQDQSVKAFTQAVVDGVIVEPAGVNRFQAARRLQSLGRLTDAATPVCVLEAAPAPVNALVTGWLALIDESVDAFWAGLDAPQAAGHLAVLVRAVADSHPPLVQAIEAPAFAVDSPAALAAKTTPDWAALFVADPSRLPPFTAPGTVDERTEAFLRHLRRFFDVTEAASGTTPAGASALPVLDRSPGNLVDAIIDALPAFDFETWTEAELTPVLEALLPGDPAGRADVLAWLECLRGVLALTSTVPEGIRFSVVEALWARGFVTTTDLEDLTREGFRDALRGSVAHEHSDAIWARADLPVADPAPARGPFAAVNPDGRLTNCIPPRHRSPLGPVAHLQELLQVTERLTCATPRPLGDGEPLDSPLANLLAARRGPVGDLAASAVNVDVAVPHVDLVNECLEHLAAGTGTSGVVHDTATDTLGGHVLDTAGAAPPDAHDAATLFQALPEHSTPAVPTAEPDAWEVLRRDFSSCAAPYDQPLDVVRTYLGALGTTRYATMRRFRREITEPVLDPETEPAGFQSHLWRYPVRLPLAVEYLGLGPVEYTVLFTPGGLPAEELPVHFGFPSGDDTWTDAVAVLSTFLERTCLSWCEFRELWASGYVPITVHLIGGEVAELPDCEPCCLDDIELRFEDPTADLRRLDVFVRLWRRLGDHPDTSLSFTELADAATVLGLHRGDGEVDPGFVRQLAAFLMLRRDLGLDLTDGTPPAPGDTGSDRTHLLAFWVDGAARREWAVRHLLYRIQRYAVTVHGCSPRPPEYVALLEENLDPLSRLAGFDPGRPADAWDARPTSTLRLAEVLTKIYASAFGVGELLFLFTADPQLQGGDPFPLQPVNEALDLPFAAPDDEHDNGLFALRDRLLEIEVDDAAARGWTFAALGERLHAVVGLPLPPDGDRWTRLGQHFFPDVLAAEGVPVTAAQRRWETPLAATSAPMWNTPPGGPFRYDPVAGVLSSDVPLTDADVITKLSRIRQLDGDERAAVGELYHLPRAELAFFSFLFEDQQEAERRLVEGADPHARWRWFRHAVALFLARCDAVAAHLAEHVDRVAGRERPDGAAAALLMLGQLEADENTALAPWEDDTGRVPAVRWAPPPNGGALHALLGLVGTGLLAEYRSAAGDLRWRETQGPTVAFGADENAAMSPLPTVVPALDTAATPGQLRFAAVRNGFAMANADGRPLGGADPFRVSWSGSVLVEQEGPYGFRLGAPTADGTPDVEAIRSTHRWRVTLRQGQRSWVLLAHGWADEEAPADVSWPARLERGFYELAVEFERLPVAFDGPEDVCPQVTGIELDHTGPDTGDCWQPIPRERLFVPLKSAGLDEGLGDDVPAALRASLADRYVPTVRDIRRTYQRAFKAVLFAHRLGLGATPQADDGQSELGYLLSRPEAFAGHSYPRRGGTVVTHRAWFDMNLWPVLDVYHPPAAADDDRAAPSAWRVAALFDWWERLFDYTRMRAAAARSPELPPWLLFHEAHESHEDEPAQLLRHLGVPIEHQESVLHHFDPDEPDLSYDVTSADLADDRWAVRVWHAGRWVRAREHRFLSRDPAAARVFLWASDGPELDGRENLTRFYRDGCIENGLPRRYAEIRALNDGLRTRGRAALVSHLTRLDRVALPWGGFARSARDLSALLLLDVEAGLCRRESRVQEAVSAAQAFVDRARLGLEPGFSPGPGFATAWDRRYAEFRTWVACRQREIYRESWIEFDEQDEARRSEAFRFLDTELRRAGLTVPQPGGLLVWPGAALPPHGGLSTLQEREPSTLRAVVPSADGIDLLGRPDRAGRPAWLAPVVVPGRGGRDPIDGGGIVEGPGNDGGVEDPGDGGIPEGPGNGGVVEGPRDGVVEGPREGEAAAADPAFSLWFEAAVGLGTPFLRIAAAGLPAASTGYRPLCDRPAATGCCRECGTDHPATVDEYYFWLERSERYEPVEQVAEQGVVPAGANDGVAGDPLSDWHRLEQLPTLLAWNPEPSVHLVWCRVHNGELAVRRRSAEGVRISGGGEPALAFTGRVGDSLAFSVTGGQVPVGLPASPPPGFRYDIAPDAAVPLPELLPSPAPAPVGGLPAFPYFAWTRPGAPILPRDLVAPVLSVATSLRAGCRHEEALAWLELLARPPHEDNRWSVCGSDDTPDGGDRPGDGGGDGELGPVVRDATRDRERRCCCPSDPVDDREARRRAVLLTYLEILAEWTDALLARGTPEAFARARLVADTARTVLGGTPVTVVERGDTGDTTSVAEVELACAPLNPRLLCVSDRVDDRLALIRACLDADRTRGGTPEPGTGFFGDSRVRDCWTVEGDVCRDDAFRCRPSGPYRFRYLAQRAQELAGEVRALGTQLLSAYERGDAEYLSQLRLVHERQLDDLTLQVRQDQWREADWQVQAAEKAKAVAMTNLQWYRTLISVGLLSGESGYEPLTVTSTSLRTAGNVVEGIGQAMNVIPDPNVGFPANFVTLPPGKKLAMIFAAAGTIVRTSADIVNTVAGLGLTKDGWERREDEWQHQVDVITIEVAQIERQILAAERRRAAALRELDNHRRVMANVAEIHDFVRDRMTGHATYLWLQKETAALHRRMYEMALHCALQAEHAFNVERGHTAERFVPADAWDGLHEGLLSGERLALAVRRMDTACDDRNTREKEIVKHVSLREHFPVALLELRATGRTEIELPEWLFDLDHPGHYMRRLRTVSFSVPAVVGPYTGIHGRLTLLSSSTRVSPELTRPARPCCDEPACTNGYRTLPDDPRVVTDHAGTDSIATSVGQSDAGLFSVDLQDPRYLPFELAGAVGRWRIELPPENNRFDLDQLADAVLHLSYTAREGGELLRAAATECAHGHVAGNGTRFVDAVRELGGRWRSVERPEGCVQLLELTLERQMFPYLTGDRVVSPTRVEILVEAPGAEPSTHRTLTFHAGRRLTDLDPPPSREGVSTVVCVGDAAWPGHYHGVLDLGPDRRRPGEPLTLGVLAFGPELRRLCNVYLLVYYDAVPGPRPCAAPAVPGHAGPRTGTGWADLHGFEL